MKKYRTEAPYIPFIEIPEPVKPLLFRDPHKLYLKLEKTGWFDRIDTTKAEEMIRFWEVQKQLASEETMRRKNIRNRKGTPRFDVPENKGSFTPTWTKRADMMPAIWDEDDFPKEAPKLERRNAICVPEYIDAAETKNEIRNPLDARAWSWSSCPAIQELHKLDQALLFSPMADKTPRPKDELEEMFYCKEDMVEGSPTPTNTPSEYKVPSLESFMSDEDWERLGGLCFPPPSKKAKFS